MKITNTITASFLLYFLALNDPINRVTAASSNSSTQSSSDISLVDFQALLYSEVNGEIHSIHHGPSNGSNDATLPNEHGHSLQFGGRYLRHEDVVPQAQDVWNKIVQHGWKMSSLRQQQSKANNNTGSSGNGRKQRKLSAQEQLPTPTYPFIVCSHSSKDMSAYQRLGPLLEQTGAHSGDAAIVLNDPKKTCFHVSMEHKAALELRSRSMDDNNDTNGRSDGDDDSHYYSILPMADLMKIQMDTLSEVMEEQWTVPESASANDWERLIRVGLSSGERRNLNEGDVVALANDIISEIRAAARVGANGRRGRRLRGQGKDGRSSPVFPLSDLFSLTYEDEEELQSRHLRTKKEKDVSRLPKGRQLEWRRSLELGLEADHSCQVMFETLRIDAHFNNKGFDIVLNPRSDQDRSSDGIEEKEEPNNVTNNDGIEQYLHQDDGIESVEIQCQNGIECTASNKHCVASLIMALSTHPSILSIETEGPTQTDDFESQWITQSRTERKRPLRGSGITGKNQIITIIDSGLDINNKYFGPTSNSVFDRWDYSQRKVVKYDHSMGDKTEPKGGHGTMCAGAAAGKVAGTDNNANGVAEDAKLHIIDIQNGNGGLRMPNAYSIFESMHSTSGTPSRIASGSSSTAYKAYPFSCRFFDEVLHDMYPGDLYVASTGNDGYDRSTKVSKMRTVGNPAACKNTLAVGASQSHGDRIPAGAKGLEYLAAFSSRGPTYDGRMKPDLVAPGASVLVPYAHEYGKTVQESGTSFSTPTVAGLGALVRQYFEEGKLPCNWSNGCKLDPSGSLVKAVLMNSATSLKGEVQVSEAYLEKKLLGKVSEYDSNQGMGLVQLDSSLPLPGKNRIKAIVKNNKQIKDQEIQDIYIRATPGKCANTSYKHELRVTLAWYDLPGANSCAKCLVNDLDLVIHSVTAKGGVKPNSKQYPNGLNTKDNRNNVERIRFEMDDKSYYRIRVKATNLATTTTKYSLIGSGCFEWVADPTSS